MSRSPRWSSCTARAGPFDELIRVYAFDDIQQAADDAAAGTVVKPVLRMPEAAGG